jgi:hypothetical protein
MYERGLLEMFKAWKAKKLEKNIDSNVINFFETNPTDEQIVLVSNIIRADAQKNTIFMLIMVFGGMIGGIFIGIGAMI